MIKHIVIWKFKHFDNENAKKETIEKLKILFNALPSKISEIKKLDLSTNSEKAPIDNFDMVLTIDFESMEDMYAYKIHPEHIKVAEYLKSVRESRAAIDYEY